MFNISFLRIEISTVGVLLFFFLLSFCSPLGGIMLLLWRQKPQKIFYRLLKRQFEKSMECLLVKGK